MLAQLIALLGRSRVFSNLYQLAHAANTGSLPATEETEAAQSEAAMQALLPTQPVRAAQTIEPLPSEYAEHQRHPERAPFRFATWDDEEELRK